MKAEHWWQNATQPDPNSGIVTADAYQQYRADGGTETIQWFSRAAVQLGMVRVAHPETRRSVLLGARVTGYKEPSHVDPPPAPEEPPPTPRVTPFLPGLIEPRVPLFIVGTSPGIALAAAQIHATLDDPRGILWGTQVDARGVKIMARSNERLEVRDRGLYVYYAYCTNIVPQTVFNTLDLGWKRGLVIGQVYLLDNALSRKHLTQLTVWAHLVKARMAIMYQSGALTVHGIPSSPTDVPPWFK